MNINVRLQKSGKKFVRCLRSEQNI